MTDYSDSFFSSFLLSVFRGRKKKKQSTSNVQIMSEKKKRKKYCVNVGSHDRCDNS